MARPVMSSTQQKKLKLLGYVDSQEDGAVLEHPDFVWEEKFIWKEESFNAVLATHNEKLNRNIRTNIAYYINKGKL